MFNTVILGVEGSAADADALLLATLLAEPGAQVIPMHIAPGRPVGRELHAAASERGADLIVVGSSGRGLLGRILAGDDVTNTLRSAPCAVAVAPHGLAGENREIGRIGVGYDGTRHSQVALDTARKIAARTGASIRAVGVATPPQALTVPVGVSAVLELERRRKQAEDAVAELAPGIEARAVTGIAHQRLAELSAEVDLLVVGSSHRGRVGRVLVGSTIEALSRKAACPLLVMTAPEPHASRSNVSTLRAPTSSGAR